MSKKVVVVDLVDDDESPPPPPPKSSGSRSRSRRSPPRYHHRPSTSSASRRSRSPRDRDRDRDVEMPAEDLERIVVALRTVEAKMNELRRMGTDVPPEILHQFHSLLGLLSSKTGGALPPPPPTTSFGPPRRGPPPISVSMPMTMPPPPSLRVDRVKEVPRRVEPSRFDPVKVPPSPSKPDPKNKPGPTPRREIGVPWDPLRKTKLLNRAAKFRVDGIEAVDPAGNPIDPDLPSSAARMQNAAGNLIYIPRMMDSECWYQLGIRGLGKTAKSGGPFPDKVNGLPLGDGLDLAQTDMPADLQFCEPGVGDITEFQIDPLDRRMIDSKAVQEWENRSSFRKCTEKLAAQLREISAIQAVAVECMKQQIAQVWGAVRQIKLPAAQATEKTAIISQLAQLEQTIQDVDTTATMFCNRSTVFFNVASRSSRKMILDKLELAPATRHALLHAPSSRSLFTDAFKWVTLGPHLNLAKPGATMDLQDPGVWLKYGKPGEPIVPPSYDPDLPLPFIEAKRKVSMAVPPPPVLSASTSSSAKRERPQRVELPFDPKQQNPLFPAAGRSSDARRDVSPPWMDGAPTTTRKTGGAGDGTSHLQKKLADLEQSINSLTRSTSRGGGERRFREKSPSPVKRRADDVNGDSRKRRKEEEDERDRESRRLRDEESSRRRKKEDEDRDRDRHRDVRRVESPSPRDSSRRDKDKDKPVDHRRELDDLLKILSTSSSSTSKDKDREPSKRRRSASPGGRRERRRSRSRSRERERERERDRRSKDDGGHRSSRKSNAVAEDKADEEHLKQLSLMSQIMDMIAAKTPGTSRGTATQAGPSSSSMSANRPKSPLSRFLEEERVGSIGRPSARY